MPYLPNIPIGTDQLSVSQPQIQSNFTIIQNGFDINHIDFDAANAGKHMYVELPVAAGNPIPPIVFPAGEIALYAATLNGFNELYLNKTYGTGPTVLQTPITASILSASYLPNSNTGSWTYLPSGLLLNSGSGSGTFSGLVTVTPGGTGFPGFQRIFSVIVCPYNGSTNADLNFAVRLVGITGTNFTIYVSSRTNTGAAGGQTGFQYLAIGF